MMSDSETYGGRQRKMEKQTTPGRSWSLQNLLSYDSIVEEGYFIKPQHPNKQTNLPTDQQTRWNETSVFH